MTAQDMFEAARLTRVRELQTQLAKAAAENKRLVEENEELTAHLDLAILAAEDLRTLPEGGRFVIVDGWNAILGARPPGATQDWRAHDTAELLAVARRHVAEHPLDFVWIVFDGPRENVRVDGRIRVSYTGGKGLHRADSFICDFLRMARFRGCLDRIDVKTCDRDFLKHVDKLRG